MGVLQIARCPDDHRLAVTDGGTREKRGHFRHQALTERGAEREEIGQVLDEASGVGIGDDRNSGYARNRAIGWRATALPLDGFLMHDQFAHAQVRHGPRSSGCRSAWAGRARSTSFAASPAMMLAIAR